MTFHSKREMFTYGLLVKSIVRLSINRTLTYLLQASYWIFKASHISASDVFPRGYVKACRLHKLMGLWIFARTILNRRKFTH